MLSLAPVVVATPAPAAAAPSGLDKINHVVVIYQENRSFDSIYGTFPGANGLANARDTVKQVDKSGQPYATLPQPINSNLKPPGPDPRFPADLAAPPFDLIQYASADPQTP